MLTILISSMHKNSELIVNPIILNNESKRYWHSFWKIIEEIVKYEIGRATQPLQLVIGIYAFVAYDHKNPSVMILRNNAWQKRLAHRVAAL